MRIVYCHACGAVSTNTWGEYDICTHCGARAERMPFHRPWQYYASSVLLLGAAALFVWGPFDDIVIRGVIFLAVLIVCVALSNWGLNSTRRRVLEEVARRKAEEGKA